MRMSETHSITVLGSRIEFKRQVVDQWGTQVTAQIADKLQYQGRSYNLLANPLENLFTRRRYKPDFRVPHTGMWRGYVATWLVEGDLLLLVGLEGCLKDGQPATISTIFPAAAGSVLADWYSGSLRFASGHITRYVHRGYGSRFEQEFTLQVAEGVVIGEAARILMGQD